MWEGSKMIKKSAFFLQRILLYFGLLIVLILGGSLPESKATSFLSFLLYFAFMLGHWFVVGREFDHRFKIYYRANSNIDRLLYRFSLGAILSFVYYILISFFTPPIQVYAFWSYWCFFGILYAWPTRHKMVREKASIQLGEFIFLDAFEKIILFIILAIFLITFYCSPLVESLSLQFKLWDLENLVHPFFKSALEISVMPLRRVGSHLAYLVSLMAYFLGLGGAILASYGLFRFFFSRRLAFLGSFCLVSTWSLSKILQADFLYVCMVNSWGIVFLWSALWVIKSGSYRTGFFWGLVNFWGFLINKNFIFIFPLSLLCFYFLFFKERTTWFRKQFLKYNILGLVLMGALGAVFDSRNFIFEAQTSILEELWHYIVQKDILILSFVGMLILFIHLLNKRFLPQFSSSVEGRRLKQLCILTVIYGAISFFSGGVYLSYTFLLCFLTFLSLIPIELVFRSMHQLRSKRSLIFVIYILICLLDSHIEGRAKLFYQLVMSP